MNFNNYKFSTTASINGAQEKYSEVFFDRENQLKKQKDQTEALPSHMYSQANMLTLKD